MSVVSIMEQEASTALAILYQIMAMRYCVVLLDEGMLDKERSTIKYQIKILVYKIYQC